MGTRKTLLLLAGKPILLHTLDRFLPFRQRICQTIIVAHPDDLGIIESQWGALLQKTYRVTDLVAGGARRQDSVRAGLARLRPLPSAVCRLPSAVRPLPSADYLVAIHDAVRPFVAPAAIAGALDAAEATGAAIVATPMKPTVKRGADGLITATVDRCGLWCAQTPQVFRRQLILDAYAAADVAQPPSAVPGPQSEATDDAQLVERLGHPVAIVPGSNLNLKITTPEDLALAEAILAHGLAPT
ncbi:MAG: 2-C-methyl-D-erythritol 4-phosphate cytidylyltransferase [Planctomycetes bacterium]|nr:2-C-methyl-D-erythritol 4-phosphate cytidylyltransferase [Planctomycetota bacterium]